MVGTVWEKGPGPTHPAIGGVNRATTQTSGMPRRRRTPAVDRVTGSGCSIIVSNPSANALEPRADAQQRPVLEQVGLEQRVAGALDVVDIERAVADHAGPGDAAGVAKRVAGDGKGP